MTASRRIVAIVQARMGSTRLPGKVLMDIAGQTMLARVIRRLQQAERLHEIVVATTEGPADEAIVQEGRRLEVPVFRGQEDDVLDRYVQAAAAHRAAVVVRVTSDCPLIDPEVIDRVIYAFITEAPDYASNTLVRTYPRGLDTEVVAMPALTQAWREASAPYQREHVTPFITEQSGRFRLVSVTTPGDYSHWRWTVDAREDLEFVRMVYGRVGQAGHFGWVDIVDLLTQHPELAEINQGVPQKPLREASGG